MIKVYKELKHGIRLISLNDKKHPPIKVADDFHIEGVVKNIIHYK